MGREMKEREAGRRGRRNLCCIKQKKDRKRELQLASL